MTPSRNDDVTMLCPVCHTAFAAVGRRQYCCDACRVAAHRRRHQPTPTPRALPPAGHRKAATIYQCPGCDELALGEQRCPDCQIFMRRIGWGGNCPHCCEPVSIDELIDISHTP